VIGTVNTAIPFLLFAWAETRIDSSLAGILQGAAPIFTVLIAVGLGLERVGGRRLAGFLVGFAGVALLLGSPGGGGISRRSRSCRRVLLRVRRDVRVEEARRVDPLLIGVVVRRRNRPHGAWSHGSRPPCPAGGETGSVLALGFAGTGSRT
jgi:drug/metabolite transporter (DMT)-like permease